MSTSCYCFWLWDQCSRKGWSHGEAGVLNRGWTEIWTKRQSHGWSKDLELWLEQDFDPGLTPWLGPGRVVACVPHPLHNRTQGRSVSFNPRSFILQHTGDICKPGRKGGQRFSLPTIDHLLMSNISLIFHT